MRKMQDAQRSSVAVGVCAAAVLVAAIFIRRGVPWWAAGLFCVLVAGSALHELYRPHDLRHPRGLKGRCVKCGYDLTGNISGVCPECGRETSDAA
jgi:hypothetical protein